MVRNLGITGLNLPVIGNVLLDWAQGTHRQEAEDDAAGGYSAVHFQFHKVQDSHTRKDPVQL